MRIADLEDGDQIVTKDFLQRELRAQLSELKAEINSKFAELKADLYPKFAELKTDIKQVHADLMQVQVNFQGKMYGMVLGSVRIGGRCLRSDYCEPSCAKKYDR